jgi:class 3 adenylate cyclase
MKSDELRKQLLAALREEAGEIDWATPEAKTSSGRRWNASGSSRSKTGSARSRTRQAAPNRGSTALSGRLDPEDLRGRCCTELVERSGGFVAKYIGDGVLAYFGYPQAHEHDAERAVRAGLALVEAVPKLPTGQVLGGGATDVVPVPPPVRGINSKGTAVLNARRAGNRGKSKRRLKTTPVLG